jgi:hypothetical protein
MGPDRTHRWEALAIASKLIGRIIDEASLEECFVIAVVVTELRIDLEERMFELDPPGNDPAGWGRPATMP